MSNKIWNNVFIKDSELGDDNSFGNNTEIMGAKIGNGCRIGAHVFIPPGVEIGNNCFIGAHTCFSNDKFPKANNTGKIKPIKTIIEDNVSIGINCTILPVKIGKGALIGGGAVVTKDVPAFEIYAGNPAKNINKHDM